MADWVDIDNTTIEPDAPLISSTMFALRDNPKAIAEGAAGAPRVEAAGLATGTAERDWVLARTAMASAGVVGTYAFLRTTDFVGRLNPGDTLPGSELHFSGFNTDSIESNTSSNVSGTWRAMGQANLGVDVDYKRLTVFLRIS